MIPSQLRTWLSSVAFLDVVGFSKRSIHDQLVIKEHMDGAIREQLNGVSREDYLLLDRGDGAAVCFLVEPEAAFFFAVHVRDALREQIAERPAYDIRVGINLGPIKIIHDVNGDRAPVGEGINCAARIMDFAGPNEILVSRSFYDVIGCQSQEYAELFSYLGRRADKHVREFELYEVIAPGSPRQSGEEAPDSTAQDDGYRMGIGSPPLAHDPEFLERVRQALAQAVGPMADILATRAAKKAPSHEALLQLLEGALQDSHQREIFFSGLGVKVPPPAVPTPCTETSEASSDSPPDHSARPLHADLQRRALTALAQRIGPIAAVLVKQAAAASGQHADEFLERLAGKLTDDSERESFLLEMRGKRRD